MKWLAVILIPMLFSCGPSAKTEFIVTGTVLDTELGNYCSNCTVRFESEDGEIYYAHVHYIVKSGDMVGIYDNNHPFISARVINLPENN